MATDPEVLQSFIEEQGLSYKKGAMSFIFDCPQCGKKDRLYIRRGDGRFVCFFCKEVSNFQGRAEFALALLCSMSVAEVRNYLYGVDGRDIDYNHLEVLIGDFISQDDEYDLEDAEIPSIEYSPGYVPIEHPRAIRGAEYIASRGIPLEMAIRYKLRYSPSERRVIFPIETEGRLVGWQKRLVVPETTWNEEKAKYVSTQKIVSSVGVPRDRVLMFGDRIVGEHAVLTEGPLDAMHCDLIGGNVATMGKAVSRGQIESLRRKGIKKLYLGLDPDAAAEVKRLVSLFSDIECYQMLPPAPYKDLGATPLEEVYEVFLRAPKIDSGKLFIHLKKR